ncbi:MULTISPECIES: transketolase [unclassified Streptomyces]|uniref:transketolase n=1 Tax=unclassified Streptomyces TaxID=2593676 RepID=UPI0013720814|nr:MULTISPECIES: transketolase [unclassified Streptomyces]MCW5249855.1 transketolase [Streptomyces sp. SHP 1-2]MYU20507.1 transketolase [Streptomyces sp. SID8352]
MTEPTDTAPAAGAWHGGPPAEHTLRVRELIVEMCGSAGGGHLGGSMSLVEILVTLYRSALRIDPTAPDDPGRDILLLSKGHGAICLYAVLAERGFFPEEELAAYGQPDSPYSAHPNPAVPGVEMPTGSLGHGLPQGVGFALASRFDRSGRRCFVVLGDGELQEGSVWEAAMAAGSLGLGGLVAVVDRNTLQITGPTEDAVGLEPLADRWRSFGWTVHETDGHDIDALRAVLDAIPADADRPTVVIAHTVKGRGLPYIEGQTRSHFARLTERPRKRALATLRAQYRKAAQT